MKCLLIPILILTIVVISFAKTNPKTLVKIAVVDTNVFNDREKGIKKLVKAENSYNIEHFTEHSLSKEIKALEEEIDLLLNQNKPINKKYVELQELKKEFENAQEEKKAEYKRKYSIIVKPVIEKIRNKLQEFNKLNGYLLVIDKSNGLVLIEGEIEDITEKFIQFCNASFEKEESK